MKNSEKKATRSKFKDEDLDRDIRGKKLGDHTVAELLKVARADFKIAKMHLRLAQEARAVARLTVIKDGDFVKITKPGYEQHGRLGVIHREDDFYVIDCGHAGVDMVSHLSHVKKVVNEVILDGDDLFRVVVGGELTAPGFKSQKAADAYFRGIKAGTIVEGE